MMASIEYFYTSTRGSDGTLGKVTKATCATFQVPMLTFLDT